MTHTPLTRSVGALAPTPESMEEVAQADARAILVTPKAMAVGSHTVAMAQARKLCRIRPCEPLVAR